MPGVNPILLIQLLQQYSAEPEDGARTFIFTKNNRMRIHKETYPEISRRGSKLYKTTRSRAQEAVRELLKKTLNGRLGKVWIEHPEQMANIAIGLKQSTGALGYGVMPGGTRMKIPEGKKIRVFTYWEKVNDIDLSALGLLENGQQIEFSWRTTAGQYGSSSIVFSGDQTQGYNGGSEYFDIDLDSFRAMYPHCEYLIFCDNIFSDAGTTHFDEVEAKAGYMMRDIQDSGEIFEPKTVSTSFRLTSDSSFCYMFAIDLRSREIVWLNMARDGNRAIAGDTGMAFLKSVLESVKIFSVLDLLTYSGTVVDSPDEADWLVTDRTDILFKGTNEKHFLHSWDTDKFLEILQNEERMS